MEGNTKFRICVSEVKDGIGDHREGRCPLVEREGITPQEILHFPDCHQQRTSILKLKTTKFRIFLMKMNYYFPSRISHVYPS